MDYVDEYIKNRDEMVQVMGEVMGATSKKEFDRALTNLCEYIKDNFKGAPTDVDLIKLDMTTQMLHTILGLQ